MNASEILPAHCISCSARVNEAPGHYCENPLHWRHHCAHLLTDIEVLRMQRGSLLKALRWTVTATAFLPGGSLRRELLRRGFKKLLDRAKREGW